MKKKLLRYLFLCALPIVMFGCGEDVDVNETRNMGIFSMSLTDAKPHLPVEAEKVLITFDEVRVHRAGGGWISLDLPQDFYKIDLLLFCDGVTTELVPPVALPSGKYTQIRIGVTQGSVITSEGEYPLEIPSQYLKTNNNFVFDVKNSEAVDLIVDFDLSQSIKQKKDGYQLKPVLHLNETRRAAKIQGSITDSTLVNSLAEVTVTFNGEEYTKLIVEDADSENSDPTVFLIYWLVPNKEYTVQVEVADLDTPDQVTLVHEEVVEASDLGAGVVFALNQGVPI